VAAADDVPVNEKLVIGRNHSPALENQHISRSHLCVSVNFDADGRALLLAHNVSISKSVVGWTVTA
jgi:hypothetical protein